MIKILKENWIFMISGIMIMGLLSFFLPEISKKLNSENNIVFMIYYGLTGGLIMTLINNCSKEMNISITILFILLFILSAVVDTGVLYYVLISIMIAVMLLIYISRYANRTGGRIKFSLEIMLLPIVVGLIMVGIMYASSIMTPEDYNTIIISVVGGMAINGFINMLNFYHKPLEKKNS